MINRNDDTANLYKTWHQNYLVRDKDGVFVNVGSPRELEKIAISEAQGYGMLITLLAIRQGYANQSDFDLLLDYYIQHTISKQNSLMSWKQCSNGTNMLTIDGTNTSATDGDLDIAYTLLKADELWGSSGQYNYRELADNLLSDLLNFDYNPTTQLLYLGNWAKNDDKYHELVRVSDLIPAYYTYFFEITQDERWYLIYNASIKILKQLSRKNESGLLPDFCWVNDDGTLSVAQPNTLESSNDGHYGWNANRTPWRLSFSNDVSITDAIVKLLTFFSKQNDIAAGYSLAGKPLVKYSAMAFVAPIAIAANHYQLLFPKFSCNLSLVVHKSGFSNDYYSDTLQTLAALYLDQKNEVNDR